MASAGCEPISGVWGRAPSGSPGGRAPGGGQAAKPPEAESSVAFEAPAVNSTVTDSVLQFIYRSFLCLTIVDTDSSDKLSRIHSKRGLSRKVWDGGWTPCPSSVTFI